ncbi:MAG: 50S ribosomal protein L22 [Chthoniobacterales bacterium]|jgi:large subunit ribosomal protein L22|nr:50S ribosomal protein L22 [Chthoniobacterales bacterium]
METRSIYRFARISPFKAREVTREIQGLPVKQALDLLAFTPKKAAGLVAKTLKSAVANAENNHQARAEALVIREAVVGEGPTLQRFQPKARGSAGPIRKRTSHIRIILTDEIRIETRETRRAAKKASAKKPTAKKKAAVKKEESAAPAETAAPAAEETK